MTASTLSDQRQAKTAPSASQSERRDWVRFPSDLEAICWAPGDEEVDAFGGVVRDISAGGIGIICRDEPCMGALVRIRLHSHYVNLVNSLDASVVSVTPIGRGEFLIGCRWERELSQDERNHML
jgi:PilZ domain